MNNNQEVLNINNNEIKEEVSIAENKELRATIIRKIYDVINALPNIPENSKYTEEEINSFINDNSIYEKHNSALKLKDDSTKRQYKEHIFLTKMQNEGKATIGNRATLVQYSPDDDLESINKNLESAKGQCSPQTMRANYQKMALDIFKCDLLVFTETDLETHANYLKNNYSKATLPFLIENVKIFMKDDNPSLNYMLENIKGFVETSISDITISQYSNPISLLFQGKPELMDKIDLQEVGTIIYNCFKNYNIKEFNEYYNKDDDKGRLAKTISYLSDLQTKLRVDLNNNLNKKIIEKNNLSDDFLSKKVFKKDGKVVRASDAIDLIRKNDGFSFVEKVEETGELPKGLTIEDIDPKIIDDAFTTANRIIFEGEIENLRIDLDDLEKDELAKDQKELKENLKKLLVKYDIECEKKIDLVDIDSDKERANVNKLILDFKDNEEIKKLINDVNEQLEVFRTKNKEAIKARNNADLERAKQEYDEYKLHNDELTEFKNHVKEKSDVIYNNNYKPVENKSFTSMASDTRDFINELNSKEKKPKTLIDLQNSNVKDSEMVKKLEEYDYHDISYEDICKAGTLLLMINQEEEKYQNLGFITKRWRRNSHQEMVNQKNDLLALLEKVGVNSKEIGKVEDYNEFKSNIKKSIEERSRYLKDRDIDIQKAYDTKVNNEREIKKLNDKLDYYKALKIEPNIKYRKAIELFYNELKDEYIDFKRYNVDNIYSRIDEYQHKFNEWLEKKDVKYQEDYKANEAIRSEITKKTREIESAIIECNAKTKDGKKYNFIDDKTSTLRNKKIETYKQEKAEVERIKAEEYLKNEYSLYDNIEKRKEIGWNIYQKLQEQFPDEYYLTKEEYEKAISNPEINKKFDVAKEMSENEKILADNGYEQIEAAKNAVLSEGKLPTVHRDVYKKMNMDDSIDAFMENYELIDDMATPETMKANFTKDALLIFNADIDVLLNNDFYQQMDNLKKDSYGTVLPFLYGNVTDIIKYDNPALYEIMQYKKFLLEANIANSYKESFCNPLSFIIPFENMGHGAYGTLIFKESKIVNDELSKYNLKEFKFLENCIDEEEREKKIQDKFAKFTPSVTSKKDVEKQLELINQLGIDKEAFRKKVFVKDKKVINDREIIENKEYIIDGKLAPGVTIQDIDPELYKDAMDTANRMIFEGDIKKYRKFFELYANDKDCSQELINNLTKLLDSYDDVLGDKIIECADPDKKKERQKINELILNFKKDNDTKALIDEINSGIKGFKILNHDKLQEKAKSKLDASINYKKEHDAKEKANVELDIDINKMTTQYFYANVRDNETIIFKDVTRNITNKINEINSREEKKPEGYEDVVSKFPADNSKIEHITNGNYRDVSIDDIKELLTSLIEINNKDAEYSEYGFVRSVWYKKTHQEMLEKKEELINTLKSLGIKEDTIALSENLDDIKMVRLVKHCKDDRIEYLNRSKTYIKGFKEALKYNTKTIDKLNNRKATIEGNNYFAKTQGVDLVKKTFINEEIKNGSIKESTDEALNNFDNYQNKYNEWLDNNPKMKEVYNRSLNEIAMNDKKIEYMTKAINDCNTATNNGKVYNYISSTMDSIRTQKKLKENFEEKVKDVSKVKELNTELNKNLEKDTNKVAGK